ncbi:MAG: pyridoxal-dependent decarboxylase [Saprospiraceae bacterium]
MEKEISKLQELSSCLEPTIKEREKLFEEAWNYTQWFIHDLQDTNMFVEDIKNLDLLDKFPISENGRTPSDTIHLMHAAINTPGLNPAAPGHLGYIPGGGLFASAIGDYLAALGNKYAGLFFSAPGAVKVENQLIRWTADLMGYPESTLGNITSGGSIANLIAVTTAREAKKITPDKIKKSVIYYSQQTHHCVQKAVRIAGLGQCEKRKIKLDDLYRMNARELSDQMKKDKEDGLIPFFVAASCGSTDTGAVDPFNAIADVAAQYDAWFHVDGAYGGYFALVDELKPLFKGIERSDSCVLDPHKSLFLPYGSGIILIKNGKSLLETFQSTANYLQDVISSGEEPSPTDLSPELTKHFRGLRMWLPIHLYGVSPFRNALHEKYLLTQYFYREVQKIGFEVGPKPQLSVGIYRYIPKNGNANEFNLKLVNTIKSDGRIFVSSTTINDIFWIRIAIVNFRTHKEHIDKYLNLLKDKTHLV